MSLGIKTQEHGEKWLSGFEHSNTKDWKEGDIVDIEIEYKNGYMNFVVPKKADMGPAASSGATVELKNILMLKFLPLLEDMKHEAIITSERLEKVLQLLNDPETPNFDPKEPGEDNFTF